MRVFITRDFYKKIWLASIVLGGLEMQQVAGQCTLFFEDFSASIGSQITTSDNSGGSGWAFTNSCSASNLAGHSAPGSVIFQGITGAPVPCQYGNSTSTVRGNLNLPALSIASTGTTTLSFNYYLINECGGTCANDKLSVSISSDNGATYTVIMDSHSTGGLASTPGGWVAKTYNLSAYAGQTILIRFSFNSVTGTANSFDGVYLDDIAVTSTAGPGQPGPIGGTAWVCQNTTATYTIAPVNAANSYSWTVPAGATLNGGQGTTSVSVTHGSNNGNLSVVATNTCGVSVARTLSVTVSVPTVVASSSSPYICQGDSTQLTATSNVPAAGTFTLGTGSITNTGTTYPSPYGNYFWGARHQMLIKAPELTAIGLVAGQISSLSFDVTAVNAATVHQGFTIKIGTTALTSITAFQTGLSTVYGPVNHQPVLGWNKHTFTAPFYWDGVSNIIVETCFNNTSFDDNASVSQSTTPYTSTIWHRQDAGFSCANSTVSGSISRRPNMKFDASGNMTYSWSPAVGLSNSSVSNPKASPSVTTTYTVTGTTNCGTVSSPITVTVNPAVTAANAGNDITICEGWTALLTASGTGGSMYLWNTGQTTASIAVSPSVSTTYTVIVSNPSGCSMSDVVNVTVNPSGMVNAGADVTICSGQTVLLNGSGNGNFSWSPPVGLTCTTCASPGANPAVTTTYTLTVTNNCGSVRDAVTVTVDMATANAGSDITTCPGGSVMLNGTGNGTYSWSPSTDLSCTTCPDPIASPASTTTYTLMVKGGCDNATDEITVFVDPTATAVANAGSDATICPNGSTTLNATGSGSYSWTPAAGLSCTTCPNPVANPASTTTYTLLVTSSCGNASDEIVITVDPSVAASANAGSDQTICQNASATLNASGNGSYSWAPLAGLSCTTCANPVAAPSVTTTYTLTVTTHCGSSAIDEIIVTVDPCMTGITSPMTENELKIAPNPGPGLFMLVNDEVNYGDMELEVINMQGKTVYREKKTIQKKEHVQIDLTHEAPGIYFLKMHTGIGNIVKKIVIVR